MGKKKGSKKGSKKGGKKKGSKKSSKVIIPSPTHTLAHSSPQQQC